MPDSPCFPSARERKPRFIPPVMGFDLFRELQQTLGLILFHFYTYQSRGKVVV
jgi:hypothetical protein